jgi:hypothetical protein
MNFFENLTEVIGWLQIFIGPFIAGLVIGFIFYLWIPNTAGLIIAVLFILLGLIIGAIIATRIWKKKQTVQFMSNVIATPELDNKENKEQK